MCLLKHEGDLIEVTGYRSFVGKLLFAMKKAYPELANPVRELSSHMECPGEEHWKSIGRMVGYLKHEATWAALQQAQGLGDRRYGRQ